MAFFERARFARVLKLSLPAAAGALVDMLQVLIDLLMVGHLEVSATAAVGIGLQFMGLFFVILGVLYVGSNALMSRFAGGDAPTEAARVFSTFIGFALLVVPVVMLLALPSTHLPFVWMAAADRVVELGSGYLWVMVFGFGALFINQIAFSALSAFGNTATPLKIKLFTTVINIFLSYALIFGHFGLPALGVQGAALGTVVAFWSESLIYGWLFWVRHKPFRPLVCFDAGLLWRGLKVGLPVGFERLLTYGSFLVFTRVVADFGTEVLAGYQIGLRIEGLAFMPGVGFTIAAMALTGRQLGAGRADEAENDALFTAFLAAGLMGVAGVALIVFAVPLVGIFTSDAGAIAQGALYLRIVGLSQVPLAVAFVLSGALRGAGASPTSLRINLISIWCFRIIPAFVLAWLTGEAIWVYLAMFVETWMRAAWLLAVFRRGDWKAIKV
jgi:putative MATE family efflux protein